MIQRIQQKHSHGCGMAALAMATGKTYDEVYDWFKNPDHRKNGITYHEVVSFLGEHGYAVNWKWPSTQHEEQNKPREKWPAEPWADVHIVEVQNEVMYHYVVMLKDGTVLDPNTPDKKSLSDYKRVTQMIAVYKIELVEAAGNSCAGTDRDPRGTYFAFADKYGVSLIPWDGGWRVDILDPRLSSLWPQYDAKLHERWKQAGHGGGWVFFYGRTVQEAVSKARSWLHRHPEIMEFKKTVRLDELCKEVPKDKCID